MSRGAAIATWLQEAGISNEVVVGAISAMPIVELRGAIPVGHNLLNMAPWLVYFLAVAGNMIPIPFLLLFLGPVSKILMKVPIGKKFFDWLFARTRKRSAGIEKYRALGLMLFVAVPLPITGGWTGSAAAFLMDIPFAQALTAILFGVMIAGVIVTLLSVMGWTGAVVAGVALCALAAIPLLKKQKAAESN